MKHIGVLESNLSGSGFEGLKVAKELGHRVTFFTRDLDRYLAVPGGARYFDDSVDEIVLGETNEFASVMHKVRQMDPFHPFAGFLTLGDYDVVVAAGVASELGLQAPDPGAVTTARNKALMRRRCAAAGVPMPRFAQVTTYEQAVAAGREIGTPCVVKPADETSGSDVRRCSSVDEVTAHFLTIATKSSNARGQRRGYPKVLVEEGVPGFEVSVEGLAMGEGRFHVFGVTDKTIGGHNPLGELGHPVPSERDGRVAATGPEVAAHATAPLGFAVVVGRAEVRATASSGPARADVQTRARARSVRRRAMRVRRFRAVAARKSLLSASKETGPMRRAITNSKQKNAGLASATMAPRWCYPRRSWRITSISISLRSGCLPVKSIAARGSGCGSRPCGTSRSWRGCRCGG